MIYGLNYRDEATEMESRYNAMVNTLSDILSCGRWDIETLFDSENNIEVREIVKNYIEEYEEFPSWNEIYYQAMVVFASEHELIMNEDIDIYTNCCLDTHIYAREGLDENIIKEMETLFNMDVESLYESEDN